MVEACAANAGVVGVGDGDALVCCTGEKDGFAATGMAGDGDRVGFYIWECCEGVDAAMNGPRPSRAHAELGIWEKTIKTGVAIFIFVVGGGFGAINTGGDVAACEDFADDIVVEVAPATVAIEEHGKRAVAGWYPEREREREGEFACIGKAHVDFVGVILDARPMTHTAGGALDDVDAVGLGGHAAKLMIDDGIGEFFSTARPRCCVDG